MSVLLILAAYMAVALWTLRRVTLEMASQQEPRWRPAPGQSPMKPVHDRFECFAAGVGAGVLWPLYYIARILWNWVFKPLTNLTKEN